MAKMDQPGEPISYQPVGDFDTFRREKVNQSEDSIEIEDLHNVEFAHYKLAMWGHPASLSHILEVIESELSDAPHDAPSTERLRELLDSSLYANFKNSDPLAENFAASLKLAGTNDRKIHAINIVRRLHLIALRSEKISPYVRPIVIAILDTPDSE
jgi:hypothetical protein